MLELYIRCLTEGLQCPYLIKDIILCFLWCHFQPSPSESNQVRISWMSPHSHAIPLGQVHRLSHHMRVSSMEATSNANRSHMFHHLFIVANLIDPETFPHIAIEIDFNGHLPLLLKSFNN